MYQASRFVRVTLFYSPPTGQRQSVGTPVYMGSGYFFERSLKAEAVVDDSIINTLRLRLSKKNKLRLKSKFSQSKAVRSCLDFSRPEKIPNSALLPRGKIPSRCSPRTARLRGHIGSSRRPQSRQSRCSSVRTSASARSNVKIASPLLPNSSTAKAFRKLQLRLEERVGLPLSLQQLTLKNAFRKAKQGNLPGRLSFGQLERVLLNLGMGLTYTDGGKDLVAQFREGDSINFLELIKSYLNFVAKKRTGNTVN